MPTLSASLAGTEGGDDVGARDDADDGNGRPDRLAEPLDDEEDHEGLQAHEGQLPERVRGHEGAHIGALAHEPEDARAGGTRVPDDRRRALLAAHLAHEDDRGEHGRAGGEEEGQRCPHRQKQAAGDEGDPEAEPAHDALPALRPALVGGGHELGEERLVRRVVDVVADEEERDEGDDLGVAVRERKDHERRYQERHAQERVWDPAPEAALGAIGERADEKRQEEREGALGAYRDPDRPRRRRRLAEQERRVGRQDADPERQREGRQRESAEEPAEAWLGLHALPRDGPAHAANRPAAQGEHEDSDDHCTDENCPLHVHHSPSSATGRTWGQPASIGGVFRTPAALSSAPPDTPTRLGPSRAVADIQEGDTRDGRRS